MLFRNCYDTNIEYVYAPTIGNYTHLFYWGNTPRYIVEFAIPLK